MQLKEWDKKNDRKDLKYDTNKYVYSFQNFQEIRSLVTVFLMVKLS